MKGLRTKRVRTVKEGTLIATVDIGATTNTGYCTCRRRQGHKGFQVREHKGGVREVLAHDQSLLRTGSDCNEVMVGYESTGPYAEPLVHYLHGQAREHRPGQPPPYEEAERGQRQLSRQDGRQGSPGDRRHHKARTSSQYRHSRRAMQPISGGSTTRGNGMSESALPCSTRCSSWSSSSSPNSRRSSHTMTGQDGPLHPQEVHDAREDRQRWIKKCSAKRCARRSWGKLGIKDAELLITAAQTDGWDKGRGGRHRPRHHAYHRPTGDRGAVHFGDRSRDGSDTRTVSLAAHGFCR